MQGKNTRSRVCVQVWMTEDQRDQLRARAADKQTSMTQYLLEAAGVQEEGAAIPTPKKGSRRWKPKPIFVGHGENPEDQMQAWLRATEATRGREITVPEWDRVHGLFLGLRAMVDFDPTWSTLREWRAGRHVPSKVETRLLPALDDFEKLRKVQYDLWDAETGHTASKRRQRRAKNLEAVRSGDAARQKRRYEKLRAEREAQRQAFIDEHVTEYEGSEEPLPVAAE
jgi:hypothetical protein